MEMFNDRELGCTRLPPCDLGIERQILSILMILEDVREVKIAIATLGDEDMFYDPKHKALFNVIKEIVIENEPLSFLFICEKLKKKNQLEEIGGEIFIVEVEAASPTTIHLMEYCGSIKKLAVRRKMINQCVETREKMYNLDEPQDLSIAELNENVKTIIKNGTTKERISTKEAIKKSAQMITDANDDKSNVIVKYHIPVIDRVLKHLRAQTHILGADSGIGKTSFALSVLAAQIQFDMRVYYFCGESTRDEIITRLAGIIGGFSFEDVLQMNRNNITAKYYNGLKVLKKYSDNFVIFGSQDYEHSLMGIQAERAKLSYEGEWDMGTVDYLQDMKPPSHLLKGSREEQVSYNISGINDMFVDNNDAGLVLSQLNRDRKSNRPGISNLKYASTCGNVGHIVSFLHRENSISDDAILPTDWYSDKTRLVKPFGVQLGFDTRCAGYVGMVNYENNEKPTNMVSKAYKN